MKLLLNHKTTVYSKFYLILFFVLNSGYLNGENSPVIHVVPVSPTAASLGQFGCIPVGYYTGTADISVPIYELELDGKKFPINIAYHASGIKVAQESGCVGLGWALQGYGSITKQVRGSDDFELSPWGYYLDTEFPIPTEENGYNSQSGSVEECKLYSLMNRKDGEPDLFHFNFGEYSGTMFFQHKGVGNNTNNKAYPLLMKVKDNLNVEYNIGKKSWMIVDGDGYMYHFNTCETTESYQFSSNSNFQLSNITRGRIMGEPRGLQPDIVTTWYLDSIVSPQKNKIKFEYIEDYIYTQKQRQETIYHLLDAFPLQFSSVMLHDLENYVYSFSKINQKVLKKINTDLVTVEVVTDDRLDIESVKTSAKPQKVSEIRVKDKFDVILKKVIFDYEYTGTPSNYRTCRLFLKRMTDKAEVEQHVYEFTYDRASLLPDKDSNAIDDWGYFNKKTNIGKKWGTQAQQMSSSDVTYIPAYQLTANSPLTGRAYNLKYLGRSREVSNEYITCGMLSSIKYPTGLVTHFEYEPHAVDNGSSGTIEKEQVVLGIAYYQNFLWGDEDEDENLLKTSPELSFTLTEETDVTLRWRALIYEEEKGYTSYYKCAFLKNSSDKILKTISITDDQIDRFVEEKLRLPTGKYTVYIVKENIITPSKYSLNISATKEITKVVDKNILAKGGGVRIKRVFSLFEGSDVSNLEYTYEKGGKSTGLLMNNPVFAYPFITRSLSLRGEHIPGAINVTVVNVSGFYVCGLSCPYTPFSFSAMGAPVGYSSVTVRDGTCAGHVEYSYYNVPDRRLSDGESYIPGFPTTGNLRNGQLLSKILYDDDRAKVEETNYTYTMDKSDKIKGFKVYTPLVFSTFSNNDFDYVYAKFYDISSERWMLTRETTTTYEMIGHGGNYGPVSVATSKTYEYSLTNDLPFAVTFRNSDMSIRQVRYKYSTDYIDPVSQEMKKRNLVNKVLETTYLCDGLVTEAEKTNYVDTLGMILPKSVYSLHVSSPLSLAVYNSYYKKVYSIDRYNKYGKIVQLSEKNNVPITYLWGYKGMYPIAEIRNATYNEVTTSLGNVYELENSFIPAMTSVENLRSLLKKSLITTYTYKVPWGIETTTSPSGMKTTYKYDFFGRLQSVIDHDGKVVQRFVYNYKQ